MHISVTTGTWSPSNTDYQNSNSWLMVLNADGVTSECIDPNRLKHATGKYVIWSCSVHPVYQGIVWAGAWRTEYMPICRWLHTTDSYTQASRQTCCCCLPLTRTWLRFGRGVITGAWYYILTKLRLWLIVDPARATLDTQLCVITPTFVNHD